MSKELLISLRSLVTYGTAASALFEVYGITKKDEYLSRALYSAGFVMRSLNRAETYQTARAHQEADTPCEVLVDAGYKQVVRIKRFFWPLGILLLVAVLSVTGCRNTGRWLAREDLPPHADALVLLMGSFPERVLQAADLYHKGLSDTLIIVNESMGAYRLLKERGINIISNTEQARSSAIALGIPAENIVLLPGEARSTLDEAIAVRNYIRGRPWMDTLILVSSPAHMRRAGMIFRTVFRKSGIEVSVGTSPSSWSSFNPDKWWHRKEDAQQVLSEWIKICSFVFFEKGRITD